MEFQLIPPVPTGTALLDAAFSGVREKMEGRSSQKNIWARDVSRLHTLADTLCGRLGKIPRTFPSTDQLHPFYEELFTLTLDVGEFKRALAACTWAADRIRKLAFEYISKMKIQRKSVDLHPLRKQFYGRASSVLKQIDPQLKFLEQCRRILRTYPTVRLDIPTVAIAGCPNVGKTSLLKALTGADPEIAPYPFTTKRLMLGYAEINKRQVQFVDTPGLLDRNEHNDIETHTVIALRHLATVIVFVFDPTETCGYPMARQRALLALVKKEFKLPIVILSNKADSGTKGPGISVSAESGKGLSEVQKEIQLAIGEEFEFPESEPLNEEPPQ